MVFTFVIDNRRFDSELELPTIASQQQNAVLTIKLRYELLFADSKIRLAGVVTRDGIWKVLDGEGFAHPILDWEERERAAYRKAFQRGEKIWDAQFLLTPPRNYNDLDFFSKSRPGFKVRPNVICAFRMQPASNPHIRITAVKIDYANDPGGFRAHSRMYHQTVPWTHTLGHELGHALGMPHIRSMLGDEKCIADEARNIASDRCYGETPAEKANIMGAGATLWTLNAKPWLERIASHTTTRETEWKATLNTRTAPEVMSWGESLLNLPRFPRG